jgi:hypothetical protein
MRKKAAQARHYVALARREIEHGERCERHAVGLTSAPIKVMDAETRALIDAAVAARMTPTPPPLEGEGGEGQVS